MYLAISTRPDIAFVMSMVAQFCQDPRPEHWEAVKCIYRYLLGTKKLALTFGEGKQGLKGFTDADGACHDHDIPPQPSHTYSCLLTVQTVRYWMPTTWQTHKTLIRLLVLIYELSTYEINSQ